MNFIRGLVTLGVRNPIFVNLAMWTLVAGGVIAARSMVRESFPLVSLDHVAIDVVYPGASPEDVEESICLPIEDAVEGIPGVREISSAATNSRGTVWLSIETDGADPQQVLKDAKDRVDQLTNLPAEAKKPVVAETVVRTEVIGVAIFGDAAERTLRRVAEEIRDDLSARPEISQLSMSGAREEEIVIELSNEALLAYHLSLPEVMAVVSRSALNLPAGVLRTADEELTLRIVGQRHTAAEFRDLAIIEGAGTTVLLGDIAAVREEFSEESSRGRFNGHPAIMLSIFKTPSEDTSVIAGIVRDYVARRQPGLPASVQLATWGDSSRDVAGRTGLLVSNGLQGLVMLFVTLAVFLGLRYAFWVSADIPLCFAGAMILMYYLGQSINMISLFALIIVAGIVVDDSIVIAESIHARFKAGDSAHDAAIEGTTRVAMPIVAATFTTVIAFIPLLFIQGVMGRFVLPVPIVVLAALVASTLDAFLILPSHLQHQAKRGGVGQNRLRRAIDRGLELFMIRWYRPAFRKAIEARSVTLAVGFGLLLLSGAYVLSGRLPFVLMPKEDGNMLRARVRFAEGAPAPAAERAIERLERAAMELNSDPALRPAAKGKLVQHVYSIAGEFADFLAVRGSNLAEVRLELMPAELRILDDDTIIERWREHAGSIDDAVEFTIQRQQLGPTEQPIEIRLLGPSLADLDEASDRLQTRLREFGGVHDVHDDLVPGKRELLVRLQPTAQALGLTLDDVARQVRYGFYGGEPVKVRRGREEVTVRVRYPEDERRSITDLEGLMIRTSDGHEIPFREVAEIERGRGHAMIMHQDNRRRVRVYADVDERHANAEQILRTLESGFLQDVVGNYEGMSYALAGDRQAVQQSLGSLKTGFWVAIIAMYAMLASMLRSYIQPLVIFLTVPFSFIGAVVGHILLGYDLTMMSLFGLVALAGLVVDHAILILDGAHELLREGATLEDAIHGAGESRFNAIILSAITDVAGLFPLLSMPHGQAQSVVPMAISFSFGLVFSAAVTLFLVPAVYVAVNDGRRFARWLRNGGSYPSAEMVEECHPTALAH